MDELLARATQGVDPQAPGAVWQIMLNLFALMPWVELFWWNLGFIVVGALLGRRRGRLAEGIAWAFVLGPIGWFVVWRLPVREPAPRPPPLSR